MTTNSITLTETTTDDLHLLFEFQLDEEANYLAAFTAKDISDKVAYLEKYTKHIADPTITMRTIKAVTQKLLMELTKNTGDKVLQQLRWPTF